MPNNGRELYRQLVACGFEVTSNGDKHMKITHPDHPDLKVFTSRTPSDTRSITNVIALIKRTCGIDITRM